MSKSPLTLSRRKAWYAPAMVEAVVEMDVVREDKPPDGVKEAEYLPTCYPLKPLGKQGAADL